MALPSNAQIDQAAETICRMAEIPGLDRGRAIFKAPDLKRVEWFSLEWCTQDFADISDVEVHVPAASSYDNRVELFSRCRSEVMEGLFTRDDQISRMLPAFFEHWEHAGTPTLLRAMARTLSDEVAEENWLELIGSKWGEDR